MLGKRASALISLFRGTNENGIRVNSALVVLDLLAVDCRDGNLESPEKENNKASVKILKVGACSQLNCSRNAEQVQFENLYKNYAMNCN